MKIYFHILLILTGLLTSLKSQDCDLAVLSDIHSYHTDGFSIEWLDFNSDALYWEIELGIKSFQRDFEADISQIQTLSYDFFGLESGTTYEIYIRTVCSIDKKSSWNGPYFINTAIENNQSCDISLSISDNNCPIGNEFYIDVQSNINDSLGVNLVLDKMELVIDHPWPPDLQISLLNPAGKRILLSSFNGNGTDDYGNSNNTECEEIFIFSDNACKIINEAIPPFIGEYKPEDAFTNLFDTKSPSGLWTLNICDRANGDIGILKHLKLKFSEEACVVPQIFQIINIEADNIELIWEALENCKELQISYKIVGQPDSEISSDFEVCNAGYFNIVNLLPNTNYELYIISICGEDANSPRSCLFNFTTSCLNSNTISHFDSLGICPSRCDAPCAIDEIWSNDINNDSNWLVKTGKTPSDLTGPNGDKNQKGNYIYIENQKNNCPGNIFITLISTCISNQILSDCGISFYYSMYGDDIGQLLLQYSSDSSNWSTLWSKNGNQGEGWNFETIKIDELFTAGLLRFVAQSKSNALRGDIALDDIKLISLENIDAVKYYKDNDQDGFGNPNEQIFVCSSVAPSGFVNNALDCDDNNNLINPTANEIICNLIDENCNGMSDDVSNNDIEYTLISLVDESCKGQGDGIIEIQASLGQMPYSFLWSNGSLSSRIEDLNSGVYYCTISDITGCQTVTDPIFVDFSEILLYTISNVVNPDCTGQETGMISILVDGGQGPYVINWNNGMVGNIITNLPDGTYSAQIFDSSGCTLETNPIQVQGVSEITSGVALKSNLDCFNVNSGFIQLGISGGEAPYKILWSNGDSSSFINQLHAGLYSVTIEDTNGCIDIISDILIEEPQVLEITVNNVEEISCFGSSTGQIDIEVKGGNEPYSYFWSNGIFTQDLFNVPAGIYNVIVTDFNTCRKELNGIIIQQNSEIIIDLDSISFANCKGSETGYIEVDVLGGIPQYSYNWSTNDGSGTNEDFIDNLLPGKYFLTVVDKLLCKSSAATFEILNLDVKINIEINVKDSLLCYGNSDASIIAQGLRGTPPFDYNWSTGESKIRHINRDTVSNLDEGSYNVTITDFEGCIGVSDSIVITSPDEISYAVDALTNNDCYDGNNGQIQVSVMGGIAPYILSWNDGQNNNNKSFLN